MHTFFVSAGERISNKSSIEKWIQNSVDGMMKQSIANTGFVNMATLGVGDIKTFVAAVQACKRQP